MVILGVERAGRMANLPTPITGRETVSDPREPLAALAEFYRAFNTRDLALMEHNWDATGEVVMDNPLGGIMRGWPSIRDVYARIFGGSARVQVALHEATLQHHGEIFVAIGRERGELSRGADRLELSIRTSRLYRWTDGRWRQIHHHGSIDDADLLARYQRAVSGPAATAKEEA
jgi:ketosteroid isomerase-like protein